MSLISLLMIHNPTPIVFAIFTQLTISLHLKTKKINNYFFSSKNTKCSIKFYSNCYLLCHSSLEESVAWSRFGRFSHGHSSLIAFNINCSSIVAGACCIFLLHTKKNHFNLIPLPWNTKFNFHQNRKPIQPNFQLNFTHKQHDLAILCYGLTEFRSQASM